MPDEKPEFDRGPMHRDTESVVRQAAQRVAQQGGGRREVTLTLGIQFRPAPISTSDVVSAVVEDCSNTRAIVNALLHRAKQRVDDVINWYEPNNNITSGKVTFSLVEVTEVD